MRLRPIEPWETSAGRLAWEAALVAFLCALSLWPFRLYGFDLVDEGTQLAQIERVARGERPYLDFETGYTPGYFVVGSWLLDAGDGGIVALRTFGILLQATTVGGLWAAVRAWSGVRLASAIAALYVAFLLPVSLRSGAPFNIPYPGWLAAPAALAAQVLVARIAARRIRRRRVVWMVCGALGGLAFSVKPNVGLLIVAGGVLALVPTWSPLRAADRWIAAVIRVAAVGCTALLVGPGLGAGYGFALLAPVAFAAWRARPSFDDGDPAASQLLWIAGGFLAVVLPWLLPLWPVLGSAGILRDVLLLDGSVVDAYLLPFPAPFWSTLVLGLGCLVARATTERTDRLPWIAALTAAGVAIAAAPLGARLAAENALLWLGPLVSLLGLSDESALRRAPREAAAFLFLTVFSLQLFPRPDSIHVAMGGPPLAVGVALLWRRYARRWKEGLGPARSWSGRIPDVALAAALVLALGRALPALAPRLSEPLQPLALGPRAPVAVLAREAASYRWMEELVEEIESRTGPRDAVFAFPDVAGLGYLVARSQPFRHLYFVPGRPDRAGEALTLRRFAEIEPRLVIACPPHVEAFAEAPRYFARLAEWIAASYEPVATVDDCTVLTRHPEEEK